MSTAQKLPTSGGLTGGYAANGTPGPLLRNALDYINAQIAAVVKRIAHDGLTGSTTIILSAKHGQSPKDPSTLRRIDDSAIISALDAAWTAAHPGAAPLVSFSVDDDAMLLGLHPSALQAVGIEHTKTLPHV